MPQEAAFLTPRNSPAPSPGKGMILSRGRPVFQRGRAVLYDSGRPADAGKLMLGQWIRRLAAAMPEGGTGPGEVWLLVFIDDLSCPVARIRLADALGPEGRRLALWIGEDQRLLVVLEDARGEWGADPPALTVTEGG